ncbi:IS1595 family transposase [Candidatus Poribacteria bacterium]|nr:IS1595 family transposase [Candidatus Poribacteria bacterium]MYH82124.1 IS1595 family transposase [Candidatus Poribacteria bacterium]MYK97138.1 IS1595 family transposase [Candidatus Poribacteria bacterium]
MNLIEVIERFPTQESCIEHLERLRWNGTPVCPHCESKDVAQKNETQKDGKIGLTGRYNCHTCRASFKVTCGTVFHGTKISLQKWFMAIALIVNAKKSLSSHQLARDLDLNQKTAWYIQTRIRAEMANKVNPIVLQGIIEADETYIGGKPRKENKKEDREPAKRGRGTSKTAVIGAVERGGQVVAEVAKGLTGRDIFEFIRRVVNVKESELMTDEYHAYNALSTKLKHHVINHQEQYVDGDKHTNTIEGFWNLLKKAYHGSHHWYSVGYTPLYVAERCYVYNARNYDCIWTKFVNGSMRV